MTRHAITNRSDEILAGTREFVPPALDVIGQENSEPVVDWRVAMKLAIRSSHELRQHLALSPPNEEPRGGICREVSDPSLDLSTEPVQIAAEKDFPTFVPLEYVQRIRRGDPRDPLLLQVMPVPEEDKEVAGFVSDPVGDLKVMPASGVLHKYHGRALVVTTGACGIHCRYCFRREFPYSENSTMGRLSETVLDFLQQHQEVEEVLLSGGDPLTLVDERLKGIIDDISSFAHVKRLRIHSRMPIVIPQRVTSELIELLRQSRLATWFVVHVNHPQELDADVLEHLGRLIDAGIPVLNQAVLLRGVNDRVDVLEALCRKLVNHRIQPYYLHQLDRVHGAAHFEVCEQRGLELVESLRSRLPGYAVPEYVVERSGETSKTPIIAGQTFASI